MKRFVLSLLILVSFSSAFSQKLYFIYLQSDNDQPFFLKMNDKIHSSSNTGYLILPRLHDSSYNFTVGFPQNKFPEQKFLIDIKGKDRGYLLKNFGEKGWGLFDLQTLAIQMALPDKGSGRIKTVPREHISPFTEILAKAANDPSLKEMPMAARMEDKPVTVQPALIKEVVAPAPEKTTPKKDSAVIVKSDKQPVVQKQEEPVSKSGATPPVKNNAEPQLTKKDTITVIPAQPAAIKQEQPVTMKENPAKNKEDIKTGSETEYKRSVVTRKSESSTSEGFGLIFIDEFADGKRDTIRILIPNPRVSQVEAKEQPKEDKKFLDISANDTVTQLTPEAKTDTSKSLPGQVTNSNCKSVASENDLSRLQKKMIAGKNEDDMVDEARKVFKSKCFTTEQLKRLSTAIPADSGKYKLFDAAYAHVSDTENFPSLSDELKDDYYINRFKAMLR